MINLNTNPGLVNNYPQTESPEQTRTADRPSIDDFNSAMNHPHNDPRPVHDNGPKPDMPDARKPLSPEELFAQTVGRPAEPVEGPATEEEMMIDKLFHPGEVDEIAPPSTPTGMQFDELVDKILIFAPQGQEPDVWLRIDDGPFAGGEVQLERCVDGMLRVTCYAGDRDCYYNFVDSRVAMRDALERCGEMTVLVEVKEAPDTLGPDSVGRRARL